MVSPARVSNHFPTPRASASRLSGPERDGIVLRRSKPAAPLYPSQLELAPWLVASITVPILATEFCCRGFDMRLSESILGSRDVFG